MHSGGTRSFNFHPSPRMVPHGCRPEVLLVELSIEQFVPREKKSKVVTTHPTPILRKLSSEEIDLLSRYFSSSEGSTLKPSLIAFPSFQSVPCAVHRVGHSIKTTVMLIDSMQHLQGLSFLSCNKTYSVQAEVLSQPVADQIGLFDNDKQENTLEDEVSAESEVELHKQDATYIKPSSHRFLFGGELLTVTNLGNISILSIPALPFKRSMVAEVIASKFSEARKEDASMLYSPKPDAQKECGKHNFSLQASDAEQTDVNAEDILAESPDTERGSPIPLSGASKVQDSGTNELSPRLTHFIEEGVVPESPVTSKVDNIDYTATPRYAITGVLQKQVFGDAESHWKLLPDSPMKPKSATHFCNPKSVARSLDDSFGCNQDKTTEPEMYKNLPGSSLFPEMETPLASAEKASKKLAGSPLDKEMKTPSFNILNDSSSDNWQMRSGAVSKSITQVPKYRRLCKYEDKMKKFSDRMLTDKHNLSTANIHEGFTKVETKKMACYRGNKKASKSAKTLIEDEAEVSGDAEVSEDEEVNENEDDYDDSFIDDTGNLTEGSTQGEKSGFDMMAMYRRSLLTQSPLEIPKVLLDSPVSVASSEKVHSSFHTPKTSLPSSEQVRERPSATCQLNSNSAGVACMPGEGSNNRKECSSKFDYRKKKLKLSFQDGISMPLGYFHSNQDCPVEQLDEALHLDERNNKGDDNVLDDDEFYQCLDLDAVEAQATELLRHKSEISIKRTSDVVNDDSAVIQDSDLNQFGHPSFDLGV